MDTLKQKFENELVSKMLTAKRECGYNPTRFNQEMASYGGVDTAKRLIAKARHTGNISDGLSTLYMCRRLDLSMEESVCKDEYAPLFTAEEIQYCKEILNSLGYDFSNI